MTAVARGLLNIGRRGTARAGGARTARRRGRRAISLLETTIALGILGVGLLMVVVMFPVALAKHRNSTEQSRALELVPKAQALLRARINPSALWVDPSLPSGADSPWYLMPLAALAVNGFWTDGAGYANDFSGVTVPGTGNFLQFLPADLVSDGRPIAALFAGQTDDAVVQQNTGHMIWYGFYRRMATGNVSLGAAVCRQRRGERFFAQNFDPSVVDPSLAPQARNPYAVPTAVAPAGSRFPLPWRVSAMYQPAAAPRWIGNPPTPPMLGAGAGLGTLAPAGSRILIQGAAHDSTAIAPPPLATAGRVLTVFSVIDAYTVEVVEDISNLPPFQAGSGPTAVYTTFDVIVFPPAEEEGGLARTSPLLEWRPGL